ncbi:MAG: cytochrome C oxidase subunit IV family protein [Proteobacteria bacterium]|nr:cytochrome C oxidase subunit IV family protein [Pseudomonadota bacterium]
MTNTQQSWISRHYNVHTIWLTMMVLTLTTYAMAKFGFSGIIAMLFLLATAALKGVLIIRDFMELRGVSLLWRVIMYGWLSVVCTAIAITYIISV